jgi:prefoldin subunit 5
MSLLNIAVALVALLGLALWLRERMLNRRGRALRDLLDGADALESQLQDYRRRMLSLRQTLTQLPSDMTAPAMASIDPDRQVKTALREILAHRLWIKQHSNSATQRELDEAVAALNRSRTQLASQLGLLDEMADQLHMAGQGLRSAYQGVSAAQAPSRTGKSKPAPPLPQPPTPTRH